MKDLVEIIQVEVMDAFDKAGYDHELGKIGVSKRPDLCEFQCNGAMIAAKQYNENPKDIASKVVKNLITNSCFSLCQVDGPGFINLNISKEFLKDYVDEMRKSDTFGLEINDKPKKVIIDYGGPNVAKPLHVGHLRSAVIGESIKRIIKYMGNDVLGDIHMGDWGLQMGLIIAELEVRKPDLVYFDPDYTGEYPSEPPFSLSELEEIYPCASAKSKEDSDFYDRAMQITKELQNKNPSYYALWKHIMSISVADLKKNYELLNVDFDLWLGESDADIYIPDLVKYLKDNNYAYIDEEALVVDVSQPTDKKEIPPCMILKSNGASLYTTTDLATLMQRKNDYNPDEVIYVVDKRQSMHFTQVFRCAKKTNLVDSKTSLYFKGFGTMNGSDGKPFKTRDGGVMRLEMLLDDIKSQMLSKLSKNNNIDNKEEVATQIAIAAIKYADLSNQAEKDYVFDIDKFTSFEGNTGPYILYTIVRIKSLLDKQNFIETNNSLLPASSDSEKALMLKLTRFQEMIRGAYDDIAPHRLCAYIYDLCNECNRFYHENKISTQEEEDRKISWLNLLSFTKDVLETCIDLLGFEAPDRM